MKGKGLYLIAAAAAVLFVSAPVFGQNGFVFGVSGAYLLDATNTPELVDDDQIQNKMRAGASATLFLGARFSAFEFGLEGTFAPKTYGVPSGDGYEAVDYTQVPMGLRVSYDVTGASSPLSLKPGAFGGVAMDIRPGQAEITNTNIFGDTTTTAGTDASVFWHTVLGASVDLGYRFPGDHLAIFGRASYTFQLPLTYGEETWYMYPSFGGGIMVYPFGGSAGAAPRRQEARGGADLLRAPTPRSVEYVSSGAAAPAGDIPPGLGGALLAAIRGSTATATPPASPSNAASQEAPSAVPASAAPAPVQPAPVAAPAELPAAAPAPASSPVPVNAAPREAPAAPVEEAAQPAPAPAPVSAAPRAPALSAPVPALSAPVVSVAPAVSAAAPAPRSSAPVPAAAPAAAAGGAVQAIPAAVSTDRADIAAAAVLPPAPAPAPVPEILSTVYFSPDEGNFSVPISFPTLDEVGARLKGDPRLLVSIYGYSAPVGDVEPQYTLSESRAKFCANYLRERHGVDPARIMVKWFGSQKKPAKAEGYEMVELYRAAELITGLRFIDK